MTPVAWFYAATWSIVAAAWIMVLIAEIIPWSEKPKHLILPTIGGLVVSLVIHISSGGKLWSPITGFFWE